MEPHVRIPVPDLGCPSLHAVLMVFGRARPGPSDELSQSIHLAGEEVTGLRTPGPIAQGFVVHNLREGLGLAVQGGRVDARSVVVAVVFIGAPPFWPSSNPTANAASRCLQCFPLRERTLM